LVQRRPQGKARAGLWELPGGKVEPGESDLSALARECREELAVEIQVGQRSWSTSHDYDDLTVDLIVYHAHMAADAAPLARDAAEIRWVEPRDLRDLRFCPADVPLVEELSRSPTV
jgi:8-oxo-dGTP diphosphatase